MINTCHVLADLHDPRKHVHHIFRSGDPSNPWNFRPILSIVHVLSTIVERIVQRHLYYFLSINRPLKRMCYLSKTVSSYLLPSFRPQSPPLQENCAGGCHRSYHVGCRQRRGHILCMIDLSKCFNVIDHSILLTKLQQHGVDTSWFASYLSGHIQTVSFTFNLGKRQSSKSLPNNIGVFQGSSLGPLLFNIFSNDLSLLANGADVFQFVDDIQVIVSAKKSGTEHLIQNIVNIDPN